VNPDAVWVVSGVVRVMGVLYGVVIVEGEGGRGSIWGELGACHCNQWGLCCTVERKCVYFASNRNYASILYRFQVITSSTKVAYFNLPYLHLTPLMGVIPFEFRQRLRSNFAETFGIGILGSLSYPVALFA